MVLYGMFWQKQINVAVEETLFFHQDLVMHSHKNTWWKVIATELRSTVKIWGGM